MLRAGTHGQIFDQICLTKHVWSNKFDNVIKLFISYKGLILTFIKVGQHLLEIATYFKLLYQNI